MSDLIGKTIGPYRVIEQIGVGGMATVYKAYQPSMDRYVAIKILPHYLSQDAEFAKRFQREGRAIARLEHAHVLPVHDYGEYEGIAYIVMRYVEAGTLKDRMAKGLLPLDEIDRLIGQIGGALDYAHRLGVIHRDVKPGNVLVDEQGDTYLTDFGLARMMEASQQLTASGVGVGTPAYMSPEQGQGIKVDHRSDIYSLGVILYEMVTGRVPFEAETPMAVMLKHITDPLPLPRSVAPDVPESVEQVILKAMAKDPADRFQTAGEMAQALATAVRQASAAEPHPAFTAEAVPMREDISFVTRVQRTWEKPRGKVALVGGVVAVVLLLGFLLSRLPGSVAIVGPEVTRTSAIAQAATPTGEATRPNPTQAPSPTPALPTATTIAPTATSGPPPALANLKWEQLYDGAIFQRANVSAIAADPQNPNVVYAATTGGQGTGAGIYKSTDGGTTWTAVNTGLGHVSVSGLSIDPADTQTIYASILSGAGPYKSTDGGASWKLINAGLPHPEGGGAGKSSLVFDPEDHLRLYYIDPGAGTFRSTDGGETWQCVGKPCRSFLSLAVDPRDGDHLFAGTWPDAASPSLYESTDGGDHWTPIAQDIPDIEKAVVLQIVIDPGAPDSVYAHIEYAAALINRPGALIASTNGGKDWAVVRTPGFMVIAVNPNRSGHVYIGGYGIELHRSEDGGRTWTTLRGGFEGDIGALAFSGDTLYVGAAGVYRTSNDGQSWELGKSGFESEWLEISLDPAGKTLYAEANDCALYRSQDGGATWQDLRSPGCGLAFDRANGWLYRVDGNTLYRSADGGRTWASVGKSPSGGEIYRIYVNPTDANTLYAHIPKCCPPFNPYIYRSTDGGQTWQSLPTVSGLSRGRMVIADDGSRMYAADFNKVEASDDGGQSWRACQRTTNNNGNSPALALHPQDSSIVLLGTWGAGILKTTNACETWSTANGGLDNLYVNTLAFDWLNPDVVYAGTDGGVFVSDDGGNSWSALNAGLDPNLIVYSIAVDPNDSSKVYAVTPDGVYRLASITEPTEALSPQAEQARAFAEPILQAIADRPPDFEDDFSTGGPGWDWDDRMADQVEIVDGVMRVNGTGGHGIFPPQNQLRSKNFVFEFDVRLLSQQAIMGTFFRQQNSNIQYAFSLHGNSDSWHVNETGEVQQPKVMGFDNIRPVGEKNRITLIVLGDQFAVYLNGKPTVYFEDATFPEAGNLLPTFGSEGGEPTPVQGEFDNFKFWNLDNVPGLP